MTHQKYLGCQFESKLSGKAVASRLLKKHKTKVSLQTNRIWVKVFKNGPSKICGRQPLNNDFSSKIEMNKKNELQSLLCHLKTKI